MASDAPPPSPEERAAAETQEVIARAERTWQRQAEREDAAYASLGRMTPLRWAMVALAAGCAVLLIVQYLIGL